MGKMQQQLSEELHFNVMYCLDVCKHARPARGISLGTHTIHTRAHTYTHAVPGVFLSSTHTIVTPEPYRLGELHTKSSLCLLPVNPIWLLAVTELHYYLPTA